MIDSEHGKKLAHVQSRIREEVQTVLTSKGVTMDHVAERLKDALDAHENKAQYDQVLCEWKLSPSLVDNRTRLEAVKLSVKILDMVPAEQFEHIIDAPVNLESRLRKALNGDEPKSE